MSRKLMKFRFIGLDNLGERSAPKSHSKVIKKMTLTVIKQFMILIQQQTDRIYEIRPVLFTLNFYCCFFTLDNRLSGKTGMAPCCVQTKAETSTAI